MGSAAPPALLFVDDHPLYREGFRAVVGRSLPGLRLHVALSAEDALDIIAGGLDVDLCLADLRLPGLSGFDLIRQLRGERPDIARALLCADLTPAVAQQARDLGCVACLSKHRGLPEMSEALDAALRGQPVFDADPAEGPRLTDRRRRVLALAAEGQSNKQIARGLGITERTVKEHWSAIFAHMGVSRRAEAVSRAQRLRVI